MYARMSGSSSTTRIADAEAPSASPPRRSTRLSSSPFTGMGIRSLRRRRADPARAWRWCAAASIAGQVAGIPAVVVRAVLRDSFGDGRADTDLARTALARVGAEVVGPIATDLPSARVGGGRGEDALKMSTPPEPGEPTTPTPRRRTLSLAVEELRLISALVVLMTIGLFLALPFVLSIGSVVFLPLVTAIILTIVLSPLADRLAQIGLPNFLASFLALDRKSVV